MRLYVGSHSVKPAGYMTLDIDQTHSPDIVADITKYIDLPDGSVDEILASHVIEHIEWPDSFKAMTEFQRVLKVGGVLKIAVPDISSLMRMAFSGDSGFHVIGLIYGVGGRQDKFQQHRYGFTAPMLVDILEVLGFDDFDWWNSTLSDASNGWVPREANEPFGMSLNLMATKRYASVLDAGRLYELLIRHPLRDFAATAAEAYLNEPRESNAMVAKVYQRIHFQLIDALKRIKYLEHENEELRTRRS